MPRVEISDDKNFVLILIPTGLRLSCAAIKETCLVSTAAIRRRHAFVRNKSRVIARIVPLGGTIPKQNAREWSRAFLRMANG